MGEHTSLDQQNGLRQLELPLARPVAVLALHGQLAAAGVGVRPGGPRGAAGVCADRRPRSTGPGRAPRGMPHGRRSRRRAARTRAARRPPLAGARAGAIGVVGSGEGDGEAPGGWEAGGRTAAEAGSITTAATLHHGLRELGWDAAICDRGRDVAEGGALDDGGLAALDCGAHRAGAGLPDAGWCRGCPPATAGRASGRHLARDPHRARPAAGAGHRRAARRAALARRRRAARRPRGRLRRAAAARARAAGARRRAPRAHRPPRLASRRRRPAGVRRQRPGGAGAEPRSAGGPAVLRRRARRGRGARRARRRPVRRAGDEAGRGHRAPPTAAAPRSERGRCTAGRRRARRAKCRGGPIEQQERSEAQDGAGRAEARSRSTSWPTSSSSAASRATRWRPTGSTSRSSASSSPSAVGVPEAPPRRPRRVSLRAGRRDRGAPAGGRRRRCSARRRACAPSTATCAARGCSSTTPPPTCAGRARTRACRSLSRDEVAALLAQPARRRAAGAARPRAAGGDVRLRPARFGGGRSWSSRTSTSRRACCAPAARAPRSG